MSFPVPHEISTATIAGTEGWERMYPYHYQFVTDEPTRHQYERDSFWFYDGLHYPEPLYPFDTFWDEVCSLSLSQYNNRIFQMPPVRGIDRRIINGHVYISAVAVTDPREIERRVPNFMERAGYYYQNWDALEARWKTKIEATIAELEAVRFPALPDLEDRSVVFEARGESTGYHLLTSYDQLINLGLRCWQYHFEFLNLGYAAYMSFVELMQRLFPSVPLHHVTQMISGIDVIMYRPDAELKQLARRALELGVDRIITRSQQWSEVEPALRDVPEGRVWLAALEEARYPWFYISTGTGWYHHDRCWNDSMNVPLAGIQTYLARLREGLDIQRPIARVRAERDRIIAEYRALIETAEDLRQFDALLACAQTVFPYVENHLFYVEHWFHSVFWNKVREVAAILRTHGVIRDIEDVWYLRRDEIRQALWDVVTAWAAGVAPRGAHTWPAEIEWRRGVMEKFRAWRAPAAIGTPPAVINEPFTIMLWGITKRSLAEWTRLAASTEPSSVTTLEGSAGSPGVASGRARVCRTAEDIRLLQDGEILVAPTISPSWAPVFARIDACVTDVGGVMSHAAIVCREYGLPAVVGTGHATRVIQTGAMIRVDGSAGTITVV